MAQRRAILNRKKTAQTIDEITRAMAMVASLLRLIGFITRADFGDLPVGIGDDTVAVYLPMSYQIGGFTTMVPRSAIQPVDMSIEQAMRFAVTAGMGEVKEG